MAVAKVWDGTAWVRAIVGAKGDPGDPGIVIDEGSGFEDGNTLVYDAAGDVWVPGVPAAGAKGAGGDEIFWENDQTVTTSYAITAGKNAVTAGPVEIDSGVTVTVPAGSEWTIV
jgi:hypothetical protein